MIKNLKILAKISKNNLDDKRRYLNELLIKKEDFLKKIEELENELQNELKKFNPNDFEQNKILPHYISRIKNMKNSHFNSAQALNPLIERTSDEIAELFAEMKKYEIIIENRTEHEHQEFLKKQQLELDEIAISKFSFLKNGE